MRTYGHLLQICGMLVAGSLVSAAIGQSDPQPAGPPPPDSTSPAQPPPPPPPDPEQKQEPEPATLDEPQSLDELLGITPDQGGPSAPGAPGQSDAGDAAQRDRKEQLDRALTEQRITDAFLVALEKMGISADLLGKKADTGLGTQRIQEEILAKLDELIDSAQQQQGGASSSSSSSSPQKQPNPKPPSKQAPAPNPGGPGENRGEATPPPMQQGDINTVIDESRSEWGNLPERVRDLMMQGQGGYKSILYRKLTDEYYKRLAEDGSS